jgi:hypothetical protein
VLEQRQDAGVGQHPLGHRRGAIRQRDDAHSLIVQACEPRSDVGMCRQVGDPGQHGVDGLCIVVELLPGEKAPQDVGGHVAEGRITACGCQRESVPQRGREPGVQRLSR